MRPRPCLLHASNQANDSAASTGQSGAQQHRFLGCSDASVGEHYEHGGTSGIADTFTGRHGFRTAVLEHQHVSPSHSHHLARLTMRNHFDNPAVLAIFYYSYQLELSTLLLITRSSIGLCPITYNAEWPMWNKETEFGVVGKRKSCVRRVLDLEDSGKFKLFVHLIHLFLFVFV